MKNSETNDIQSHSKNTKLSDIAFIRNRLDYQKENTKYVYSYILPDGSIKLINHLLVNINGLITTKPKKRQQ